MRLCPQQSIILGPPGCGKTTRLLSLVQDELAAGVSPEKIAYFSFTKKAVEVAKARASDRFGFKRDDLPYFRTVHSVVFMMNAHARSDVMAKEQYEEISKQLGISFTGTAVDESTGMPFGKGEGDQHLFIDTLARARRIPLAQQWEEADIPDLDYRAIERTVEAVRRYKKAHGLVDFTDMLEWYIVRGTPLDVDVAFVDEAQDLSLLQWHTLQRLLSKCPTVYIAGDDDQAIYRWSGADVSSFLALEGPQEVLNQSHRCPDQIKQKADEISYRIHTRFKKEWAAKNAWGRVDQIHSIDSFDIAALTGTTLLLARNTYLLSMFKEQLEKRGLPYKTTYGSSSVTRAHAKAVISYVRLQKGQTVTGSEARFMYDQLRVGVGVIRGFKALPGVENDEQYTMAELQSKHGLLASGDWWDALDGISGRERMYYRSILRRGGNLFAEPTIQVNTIHGVKGGEADNVIVCPDMSYQSYRHYERDPDDEHRVAYVAVSRSKENLFLLSPTTKNFYPY